MEGKVDIVKELTEMYSDRVVSLVNNIVKELTEMYSDRVVSLVNKIVALESKLAASQAEVERLRGEYKSLIKSINPMAQTREEAINTLKARHADCSQVLKDLNKATDTIESREAEIESLKEDVDGFQDAHADAYDKAEKYRLKYRRLVEVINNYEGIGGSTILKTHRANEAKLKAKRGKK